MVRQPARSPEVTSLYEDYIQGKSGTTDRPLRKPYHVAVQLRNGDRFLKRKLYGLS